MKPCIPHVPPGDPRSAAQNCDSTGAPMVHTENTTFSYGFPMVFPLSPYAVPIVSPLCSCCFAFTFLRFSYGSPIVSLWFPRGVVRCICLCQLQGAFFDQDNAGLDEASSCLGVCAGFHTAALAPPTGAWSSDRLFCHAFCVPVSGLARGP